MSDFITISIGALPGPALQRIGLVNDRTVKAALERAGLSADGRQIRVNGQEATLDTVLSDNATVTLLSKVKGNNEYTDDFGDDDYENEDENDDESDDEYENTGVVTVNIGKLPGAMVSIALNGDHTVGAAIDQANIGSIEGWDIRVGGNTVDRSFELRNGQTVALLKKVKGNK